MHHLDRGSRNRPESDDDQRSAPAPGRRTLTMSLPPGPDRAAGPAAEGAAPDPAQAHHTAQLLDYIGRPDLHPFPDGGGAEVPYRADMERSFGMDFGGVQAFFGRGDELDGLGAEAATRDGRIAFGTTSPSRELVAHELAHVAQERLHGPGAAQAKGAVSSPDHPAEQEADAVAERAARGERVTVAAAPAAALSLKGKCNARVTGGKLTYFTKDGKETVSPGKEKVVVVVNDERSKEQFLEDQLARPNDRVDVEITWVGSGSTRFGSLRLCDLDFSELVEVKHKGPTSYRDIAVEKGARQLEKARIESLEDDQDDEPEPPKLQNGDTEGGGDSLFRKLIATRVDGDHIVVEFFMSVQNRFDRVHYEYKLDGALGGESKAYCDDKTWWNNPSWTAATMDERYGFRPGFVDLAAHGADEPRTLRKISARIPKADWQAHFGGDANRDTHRRIYFALKIWRAPTGPTGAEKDEYEAAYGEPPSSDHNDGYLRGSKLNGLVEYSDQAAEDLGLDLAPRLEDHEVWSQPLGKSPSPNVSAPFPKDYPQQNRFFAQLVPRDKRGEDLTIKTDETGDSKLRLATRIENEATLKLSSHAKLTTLVKALLARKGRVNDVMHGGGNPKLAQFNWRLSGGDGNVFTDIYMDDPDLHALRAGVGIRKRMSTTDGKEITKLNVKTGEGYNVGEVVSAPSKYIELEDKSDVYRRHELGFDIDRESSVEDIGGFLHDGTTHNDPWNKSGDEANRGLDEKDQIDFTKLKNKMVLQGDRTKFKLQAMPKHGTNPINIEISCDHTVGRTWEDYDPSTPPEELFDSLSGKYEHIYNIEVELEHQGATIGQSSSSSGPVGNGEVAERQQPSTEERRPVEPPPSEDREGGGRRRMPEHHPGRLYLKEDAESEQFNTPSFEIFHHAHDQLITWMRSLLDDKDGEELGEDRQKLESMRDRLLTPPTTGERKPPRRTRQPPPQPSQEYGQQLPVVMGDHGLPILTRSQQMTDHFAIGQSDGDGMNCLLNSLFQVAPVETIAAFGEGAIDQPTVVANMRKRLIAVGFTNVNEMLDIADPDVGQALLAALDLSVVVYKRTGFKITTHPVIGRSSKAPKALYFWNRHYMPLTPQ